MPARILAAAARNPGRLTTMAPVMEFSKISYRPRVYAGGGHVYTTRMIKYLKRTKYMCTAQSARTRTIFEFRNPRAQFFFESFVRFRQRLLRRAYLASQTHLFFGAAFFLAAVCFFGAAFFLAASRFFGAAFYLAASAFFRVLRVV